MDPVRGLQIQVREAEHVSANVDQGPPLIYKEFMTCQNYESTIGKSTHRTIALRPDRKFQIHILVKKEFNWGEANAIRLNIDFDVGQEVRDVEQIILKEEIEHVTTGLVFDRCNEGFEVYLDRLTRQLGGGREEEFSFATQLLSSNDRVERANSPSQGGIVVIQWETCKATASRRGQEPPFPPFDDPPKLFRSDDDVRTRTVLCEKFTVRPTRRYDFVTRPVSRPSTSILYYHYRIPEVYNRLIAQENCEHDGGRHKRSLHTNARGDSAEVTPRRSAERTSSNETGQMEQDASDQPVSEIEIDDAPFSEGDEDARADSLTLEQISGMLSSEQKQLKEQEVEIRSKKRRALGMVKTMKQQRNTKAEDIKKLDDIMNALNEFQQ